MIKQWWLLLYERFSIFYLVFLIPYAFLLVRAGRWVTRTVTGFWPELPLVGIILLQFVHLRVLDEIKDYSFDCKYHPRRPLARGACSIAGAWGLTVALIAVELILIILISPIKALVMLLPLGYTFLIFKSFFLPGKHTSFFFDFLEIAGDAFFPVVQYLGILLVLALIPGREVPAGDPSLLYSTELNSNCCFIRWLSALTFYFSFFNILICLGIFLLFLMFGIIKYKKKKRIVSGE